MVETVDFPVLGNISLDFDFAAPRKIVFGWGRRKEAGTLARGLGSRAWLVVGSPVFETLGVVDALARSLAEAGVELLGRSAMEHEPEVADVDRETRVALARGLGSGDLLIGLGGGAAIDLAKAIAAMVTQRESGTVRDYLEGVGRDLTLRHAPLPVLAIPTTAGTGAEATKNAVISHYDPPFKKSLRDDRMMPTVALVDPELTRTVPRQTTVDSGMDAITQLIESYISRFAKPLPRALAEQGLQLALPAIVQAADDGDRRGAREKMAYAAMLSGMCLANSGLGLAHGVAPALGTHCRVPHGRACALMLPVALRANAEVARAPLARLGRITRDLPPSSSDEAACDHFLDAIESICERVGAPRRLSEVGVPAEKIPAIVRDSRGASMRGNPRDVDDEELTRLLEAIR